MERITVSDQRSQRTVLPDGTMIDDFGDVACWCAEAGGAVIIDGTEFSVARPQDQAAQRPFYSGKKKLHTTKTIAVCDRDSNLLWATPEAPRVR